MVPFHVVRVSLVITEDYRAHAPTTCTVFERLGSLDNDSTSSTVTSD
jgi:hypothetical protein